METQRQITIALADDHVLVRKAIAGMIEFDELFKVTIEANNGEELIKILEHTKELPDICVLDIGMKKMSGLETLPVLRKRWPSIKVLMLSMFGSEHNIDKALRNGASGYLLKDCDPDELLMALKEIYDKGIYTDPEALHAHHANNKNEKGDHVKITGREMEFLLLCCTDMTYAEIAESMKIGSRTVDTYRDSLFTKFSVSSRTALVVHALQNGTISLK